MAQRINTPSHTREAQVTYPPSPFRLFEELFNDWALRSTQTERSSAEWRPPVDILEKDGKLLLQVEVPGISEKDFSLKLEGDILTVRGERKNDDSDGFTYHMTERNYGVFSRSFTLPNSVDPDHIEANYKNGVLTIAIPQKPEAQVRSIKVNT